ncbi:MAG: Flp family type IVb pilin [Bdellovibrionota bacterium]
MKIFNKIDLLQEAGASLVEYALLVALISSVSIGAVTQLGGAATDPLQTAAIALNSDGSSGIPLGTMGLDGGTQTGGPLGED